MKFNEKKDKKYFVKDESLRGIDGDMFNYSDIAQVLDEIISTNTPPYNVAVIGKWGLGKSSLINLVTEKYRKDGTHYQVQEINAWKYEKESLRKVFLKQLWQGISNQRIQSFETVKKEISNIISAEMPKEQPGRDHGRTKRFCWTLLLIFAGSVVAFALYKIIQAIYLGNPIFSWDFLAHIFFRYCKNASTVLIAPILVALCKLLLDDYHAKQSKKIELNFPIETTDDYEIFLETKIKEQLKENPDLKIITVIDDLDRLSIDKIVEALDALKAFVGFERCIFIVPFDDEIIKCALDKRRMQEFNERTEVTDVIESELILDKLFQFKIYLPPILDFDIQQYAYKLAQQEVPDFISEYCSEATIKKVVERVLIYPGVSTPRQVKKLLNAFINNLMIVSARESSGKIQRGLLTSENGIMQIAKMSVLQADFNNFYDLLFKDMRCIELVLSAHKGEKPIESLPMCIRNYFDETDGSLKLKSEYETLLNFLHRTAKYKVDSIAPYLYLAQDEISVKTGDELQRRTVNALKSRNTQTLRDLLRESGDLVDVILYHLSRESGEIGDMLWVTMMVYEEVESVRKPILAQCIIERIIELDFSDCEFLYGIPSQTVFSIADIGENDQFNHQFKTKYLSVLSNANWFDEKQLSEALAVVFENYSTLNSDAKTVLKRICDYCLDSDSVSATSLFDVVIPEKPEFMEYWGLKWFEKLCAHVDAEGDFSTVLSERLQLVFNVLRRSTPVDTLVEIMLPLVQYSAFLPVLDSLINQSCEDEKATHIKDLITPKTATELLENVISHDFKKNEETICRIVDGLNYEITEKNASVMDEFTLNYSTTYALDNIILYCGKCSYFELLPKTIAGISESVFNGDENDELLQKIASYFTATQVESLGKKLFDSTGYSSSKNYERELSIIRVISLITGFEDELEKIADSKILSHFASYHTNENYRNFVSVAMGSMKDIISQECIDKYVGALASRYSSYRQYTLEAINRVVMKMSSGAFKSVFEKVTTQSEAADFELAIEVIQNHNEIRPLDQDNINRYYSFLVKNLPTAKDPNLVLSIIRGTFSSVPSLQDISVNAQKNPAHEKADLAKTIAYFVDKEDDIENVSDALKGLCEVEIDDKVIVDALSRVNNYHKNDIYSQLANELQHVNAPNVLMSFTNIACHSIHVLSARKLVIDCLQVAFKKVDFIECSRSIMEKIKANEAAFKGHKEELANVLREGFVSTTSDNLKHSILLLVSSLRIKPQFKKTLTGDDMAYYKKYAS